MSTYAKLLTEANNLRIQYNVFIPSADEYLQDLRMEADEIDRMPAEAQAEEIPRAAKRFIASFLPDEEND